MAPIHFTKGIKKTLCFEEHANFITYFTKLSRQHVFIVNIAYKYFSAYFFSFSSYRSVSSYMHSQYLAKTCPLILGVLNYLDGWISIWTTLIDVVSRLNQQSLMACQLLISLFINVLDSWPLPQGNCMYIFAIV